MTRLSNILAAATAGLAVAIAATPSQAQAPAPTPETKAQFTAKLQSKFKELDTNKDGSVDKKEADVANNAAAKRAEATLSSRMEAEFTRLDTNKDKQISLTEFKAAAPTAKAVPGDQVISRMDNNKDQKISFAEFSSAPMAAFNQIDTNHDGTVSVDEQKKARQ